MMRWILELQWDQAIAYSLVCMSTNWATKEAFSESQGIMVDLLMIFSQAFKKHSPGG